MQLVHCAARIVVETFLAYLYATTIVALLRNPRIIDVISKMRSYNTDLCDALYNIQFDASIMFIDTLVRGVSNMTAEQRAAQRLITQQQMDVFDKMDTRKPDEFFKAMGDVVVKALMPLCQNDDDCPLYWVRKRLSAVLAATAAVG